METVGLHPRTEGMAKVRTREPQRRQVTFRVELPEDALPIEHPARLLWRIVGQLDLSKTCLQRAIRHGW